MTRTQVEGLISRRGVRVLWQRATPPASAGVDDFFNAPVAAPNTGSFGESYGAWEKPIPFMGYYHEASKKMTSMNYGIANEVAIKLAIAVPFAPDPAHDVPDILDPAIRKIYEEGDFIQYEQKDDPHAGIALDRFYVLGRPGFYTPLGIKPLVDANTIFAYSIDLKGFT